MTRKRDESKCKLCHLEPSGSNGYCAVCSPNDPLCDACLERMEDVWTCDTCDWFRTWSCHECGGTE